MMTDHRCPQGHATWDPARCAQCSALDVDLPTELTEIRLLVLAAQEALQDEAEGRLRSAIVELHTRAAACLHLVATW